MPQSQVGNSRALRRRGRMAPAIGVTKPAVTGTFGIGNVLTAVAGSWPPAGSTLSYKWVRGKTDISGATASTYTVTSADVGKRLVCRITATGATGQLNHDVAVNN